MTFLLLDDILVACHRLSGIAQMEDMQGLACAARDNNCSDEAIKAQRAVNCVSQLPNERKGTSVKNLPLVGAHAASPNGVHQAGSACSDDGPPQLSHPELKEVFRRALSRLLADDPILKDLHPDMTHQEVSSEIEMMRLFKWHDKLRCFRRNGRGCAD